MGELNKPFPAYQGDEPYVFVCYAHSAAKAVYADLLQLNEQVINLWYDEGSGPLDEGPVFVLAVLVPFSQHRHDALTIHRMAAEAPGDHVLEGPLHADAIAFVRCFPQRHR